MRKAKHEKVYRYQAQDYRIDIIVDDLEEMFEARLSRKDLGISIDMFGISFNGMCKNGYPCTLAAFRNIVKTQWSDYIPVLLEANSISIN